MAKPNARLDAARKTYREALDAARSSPTPETWAKLLAAGKELSAAEDPRSRGRRGRRRPQRAAEAADGVGAAVDAVGAPVPVDAVERGEGVE